MIGIVDNDLRALLEVQVGSLPNGPRTMVVVWVDTAFNGGLVLPRQEVSHADRRQRRGTSASGNDVAGRPRFSRQLQAQNAVVGLAAKH